MGFAAIREMRIMLQHSITRPAPAGGPVSSRAKYAQSGDATRRVTAGTLGAATLDRVCEYGERGAAVGGGDAGGDLVQDRAQRFGGLL